MQHFWFLDIRVGGLALGTICKLALAALLAALMVPGLVYSRASPTIIGALLVLQVGAPLITWLLMHIRSPGV